jgi:hypothetical protein
MKKKRPLVIVISIAEGRVWSEDISRHKTLQMCDAHCKTAFKSAPAEINIWQTSKFPLSKANHSGVAVVSPILISRGNRRVSCQAKNKSAYARAAVLT